MARLNWAKRKQPLAKRKQPLAKRKQPLAKRNKSVSDSKNQKYKCKVNG